MLDAYLAQLTEILTAELGDDLVAAYLHGSAVLGGFQPERSDVDVLVIVRASLGRERLTRLAPAVNHERLPVPAQGLELDVITLEAAQHPEHPSPFELNLTSGPGGDRVALGEDHGPNTDVILHLAVSRAAGRALAGPPADELLAPIPREWLLGEFRHELDWALEHASTAYQVLNAARGWRFASEGVICSKLAGARWARGRGFDDVLADAIAFQLGESDRLPDPDRAAAIVARAQSALA